MLAWVLPGLAGAACPLLPGESKIDFRLVEDRRSVELRRHGIPNSAAPTCVLELACRVRPADVRQVSYTLRRNSILLGDIASMQFLFLDGSEQSCEVADIKVPQ